jgi:phosphatidylserine/phosphatidylglycerophosphate/cardiolipin synthase-like enzyme
MPWDSKAAKKEVISLINNAKVSIDIAMYNINYKKFSKAVEKASKNVKITIFYDKKSIDFYKNIMIRKTKKKLHTKIMIIDKKIVVFGSPNWDKKAFSKNYEVMYTTDKLKTVNKFNNFFTKLKETN